MAEKIHSREANILEQVISALKFRLAIPDQYSEQNQRELDQAEAARAGLKG